ncbi:hypothetical protein BpHYR1_000147 [Brachionus plicatilis]|uniref:Uncharacterized protein n=1 Tax=Brachionus plicatilis TaxID=10195 RepID=A0A3M7SCX3_BRAPC|nr:hypothetical protein BpHYR1_000147 [Brachionus plicatilis]
MALNILLELFKSRKKKSKSSCSDFEKKKSGLTLDLRLQTLINFCCLAATRQDRSTIGFIKLGLFSIASFIPIFSKAFFICNQLYY